MNPHGWQSIGDLAGAFFGGLLLVALLVLLYALWRLTRGGDR